MHTFMRVLVLRFPTQNQGIGMLVPRSVQGRDGDIIIKGLFLVLALTSTSFEIPAVFDY